MYEYLVVKVNKLPLKFMKLKLMLFHIAYKQLYIDAMLGYNTAK